MTPDHSSSDLQPSFSDVLTPAQQRRLEMWRAMTSLAKAQANGALSPEQTRLLDGLADNLRQLATQMSELAELGRRYVAIMEAQRQALSPDSESEGGTGSEAVA